MQSNKETGASGLRVLTHSYWSFLLAKQWNSITPVRGDSAILPDGVQTVFDRKDKRDSKEENCLPVLVINR